MGIAKGTIRMIARTLKDHNISGKAITYGVQGVQGQYDEIVSLLKKEGYDYSKLEERDILTDDITQFGKTLHQETLFKLFGFSEVESLDYFDNEKPTHVINLNKPVSDDMQGEYDLVYDGGTTEHCFNVKEVMFNTVRLLKTGGIAINHLPMTGLVNHGFYHFSPVMFFDFYSANGFEDIKVYIDYLDGKKRYCYEYVPFDDIPEFIYSKKALVFCFAVKKENVENITVPIQGGYVEKYGKKKDKKTETAPAPVQSKGIKGKIKQCVPEEILSVLRAKAYPLRIAYRNFKLARKIKKTIKRTQ